VVVDRRNVEVLLLSLRPNLVEIMIVSKLFKLARVTNFWRHVFRGTIFGHVLRKFTLKHAFSWFRWW